MKTAKSPLTSECVCLRLCLRLSSLKRTKRSVVACHNNDVMKLKLKLRFGCISDCMSSTIQLLKRKTFFFSGLFNDRKTGRQSDRHFIDPTGEIALLQQPPKHRARKKINRVQRGSNKIEKVIERNIWNCHILQERQFKQRALISLLHIHFEEKVHKKWNVGATKICSINRHMILFLVWFHSFIFC